MPPRGLPVLLLAALLGGCAGPAPGRGVPGCQGSQGAFDSSAGEGVVFATGDGVELHGTLWSSADGKRAAALAHGLNEDRGAWEPLVGALGERGYSVLAFDLRGHGASTVRRGEPYELRNFSEQDFALMEQDVAAAVELLRGRSDPACIAVIGASIGANLGVRVAASKPGVVEAAAMLSPGLDYRGVRAEDAVERYEGALFLAAARGDLYSAQSSQVLAGEAEAEELVLVEGEAHGTALLRAGDVQQRLVAWLAG